ncbi:ABC transporter substrate-binding protein [Terasakiispira papahanaumokuakeensis]|uniref:ABC transporter substrate-binding protein n=1 Tax=Terasakiispira papahanaumokuakeensis TaxID=197479 RepID=A0A1E2VEM2_9GAMM|nr:ABC transporter substrate-binding protein [Terasakiispira papahanaumokuakeensis]
MVTLLTGLLTVGTVQAQESSFPLTLENCGQTLTFEHPVERIVTVGQATTEILYALGLADKVKATSVWFTPVQPKYQTVNSHIPRLADNDPSFESVVNQHPDLVTVQYEWHIGANGIVGTREQFHDLGIPTYVMPTDCVGKDNSTGMDGTRLQLFSTQWLFQSVQDLADIAGVHQRGAELVDQLKAREDEVKQRAHQLDSDLSAVFWYSSADMNVDPFVAGSLGAPAYMMKQLGIHNIVDTAEEWPMKSWESIAKANPDIIVIAKMDRRRFPADDYQKKLEFLHNDPVASQMDAVKNDHIIMLEATEMDATLRMIEGMEKLIQALQDQNMVEE